jgi:PKD repeat protein
MGVKISCFLLLLFFIVSCQPSEPFIDTVPSIEEFTSSASTLDAGQAATFSWRVTSAGQNAVRCQLDVEGDGVFDYTFANCKTTTSQVHTYSSSGSYQPTLAADNAQGRSESVTTLKALGAINLEIEQPASQAITGTPMNIGVSVESRLEVALVEASVGDRVTSLQFNSSTSCDNIKCLLGFTGSLSLEGLPRGSQILKVRVRDIAGNESVGYRRFVYDRPPTLAIETPSDYSVALPTLNVKTQCFDDDAANCLLRVFREGTTEVLAESRGTLETTLNLSQFDNQTLILVFEATDSAKQVISQKRMVYVSTSSKLTLVNTVAGRILQVNERGILYSIQDGSDNFSLELGYLNRQTGVNYSQKALEGTSFPTNDDPVIGGSFLTGRGAVLTSGNLERGYSTYEWIDGNLELLGDGKARAANGNYIVWETASETKLKNLSTGAEQTICQKEGIYSYYDLAENGAVACSFFILAGSNSYYTSYFWKEGVATRLSEGVFSVEDPLTDGVSVVYRTARPGRIMLYSPTGENILSEGDGSYKINNGRVAFTRSNNQAQLQVWLRTPSGEEKQLTFFGAPSVTEALSPNGEVVFTNAGKRYWITNNHDLREIPSIGKLVWLGGWYLVVGNSLFQVTP